ncbi:hypothetical protein scyTo_0012375 [Scyliorhinus torazame]|uniref:Uncharacterized protein n=1 Tax=Scyliorhinus torazame TaxID=75743 RepID=A0A401P7R6_SCYTO|nr:hypothetical protein [Scyliorhinus torazame]
MTTKGAYGQVRKSWEVTKVFVTKATLGVVSKITTFLSKCKFPRAAAIGAVGGVGVALLIGCIVADRLVNEPEDIKLVVETAIRKVFIEEKAHKICSTINAYQNRRWIFANNKQKCCEELIKYERKLFNQLQLFSDIMHKEPQNATVLNLYVWLKSARCHLEMFSEMVHFGVSDAGELRRAAEMHCSTLTPLVAAVKDQKAKVIRLIPLLFGIRLTDKEVDQSVIIFHPCSNTDAIKDKYLTLVFNEQVKSAEEEFKSLNCVDSHMEGARETYNVD